MAPLNPPSTPIASDTSHLDRPRPDGRSSLAVCMLIVLDSRAESWAWRFPAYRKWRFWRAANEGLIPGPIDWTCLALGIAFVWVGLAQ